MYISNCICEQKTCTRKSFFEAIITKDQSFDTTYSRGSRGSTADFETQTSMDVERERDTLGVP